MRIFGGVHLSEIQKAALQKCIRIPSYEIDVQKFKS